MQWLSVLSQWLHLLAAVTGIGALIYARLVLVPSLAELEPESRRRLIERATARMRPITFTVIGVLLATGLYNYISHLSERPTSYHVVLALKILLALHVFAAAFLLALHVFAAAFLLAVPPGGDPARDARRPRLMTGAAISGVVILLLSAFLRRHYA